MRTLLTTAIASLLLVGACGKDELVTAQPAPGPTETTAPATMDREKCPRQLRGPDDTSGDLGLPSAAPRPPAIDKPTAAWVCSYQPKDDDPGAEGPISYTWTRFGEVHRVGATQLVDITASLGDLVPVPDDRACRLDLGTRWLVVLERRGMLTGITVDDFGCGDVLMTDDPFETAPGEAQGKGTVGGALNAPPSFLQQVKSIGGDNEVG